MLNFISGGNIVNKLSFKLTSGVISGMLLFGAVSIPIHNVYASEIEHSNEQNEILFNEEEIQSMENFFMNYNKKEFYEALEVKETKAEFLDPSVAQQLLNVSESQSGTIQTFGKVTYTAKAGAKAIKAVMKKVGKKAWDKMIKKIESLTATQLVIFHWGSINKALNFLADSGGKIEEALTKFLVKKGGFNKTVAKYISKAFVLIVF